MAPGIARLPCRFGQPAREPDLLKRPKRGTIGLQNHGTAVEFRNIAIKLLDK